MANPMEELMARILKICNGIPGSIVVFGNLARVVDDSTLELVVCAAERAGWVGSEAHVLLRECGGDYEKFLDRMLSSSSLEEE